MKDDLSLTERMKRLGQRIKEIRNTQAITLEQLAVETGRSTKQLIDIELGLSDSDLMTLNDIANVLEVPLKDFFTDK